MGGLKLARSNTFHAHAFEAARAANVSRTAPVQNIGFDGLRTKGLSFVDSICFLSTNEIGIAGREAAGMVVGDGETALPG